MQSQCPDRLESFMCVCVCVCVHANVCGRCGCGLCQVNLRSAIRKLLGAWSAMTIASSVLSSPSTNEWVCVSSDP